MQKKNNWLIALILIVISALCWIENSYFTEASTIDEGPRKIWHIIFLVVIMGIGYTAWYKEPIKWPRKLWLFAYLFAIGLILAIGAVNAVTHVFTPGFLDVVRSFRVFFCSPVPFLALVVLARIGIAGKPVETR